MVLLALMVEIYTVSSYDVANIVIKSELASVLSDSLVVATHIP